MQVFFSTVVRSGPQFGGGELIRVDWATKKVVARVPVFASDPDLEDPNPRGNTRGGRGIEILDGEVLVSSYHTFRLYDFELNHLRDLSHPLMVNLHETHQSFPGRVWFTSTAIDSAVELDLRTGRASKQFWPREMPGLAGRFHLEPMEIDKEADNRSRYVTQSIRHPNHIHLNAIACRGDHVLGLLNRFGAIVDLDADEVLIEDPALRGGHNLVILEDGRAVVNGTRHRTVHFYDLDDRRLVDVIDLLRFPYVFRIRRRYDPYFAVTSLLKKIPSITVHTARPVFVRGLWVHEDLMFVGISPASILCLNWRSKKLIDVFPFSKDVRVCVHGIRVLPDD